MMKPDTANVEWKTAKKMVDSFAMSTGVSCRLYNNEGKLLHICGQEQDSCGFCKKLTALTGQRVQCRKIHQHGALEAERFGGRYVYFCPSGMAYFSSPIILSGRIAGALVGGPVLIIDEDEIISDALLENPLPEASVRQLEESLASIPKMQPARLSHLSAMLFAGAVYVSDSTHELFLARQDSRQQDSIGTYIQQFKAQRLVQPYPTETEHDLVDAIGSGNLESAEGYLNELLGYLIFSSSPEELKSRMSELLAVMGRAALYSGANHDQVFSICHQKQQELMHLSGSGDMSRLMLQCLRQVTELVYQLMDTRHKNIMRRSVNYIERNYARKLTLQQVADYAGYSPSYYSKLFHEELGCTFGAFLNRLRVEKSKSLLLSTTLSGAEIAGLVGFEDQSYFSKVFKKLCGVTPDQYRKRKRRIDDARERDKSSEQKR